MQPSENTWRAIDADGNETRVAVIDGPRRVAKPLIALALARPVTAERPVAQIATSLSTEPDLTEQARRARVMALWAEGMDTFTIGELLGLPEHEICRIMRDARDIGGRP